MDRRGFLGTLFGLAVAGPKLAEMRPTVFAEGPFNVSVPGEIVTRTITAIDYENRVVTFSPALHEGARAIIRDTRDRDLID